MKLIIAIKLFFVMLISLKKTTKCFELSDQVDIVVDSLVFALELINTRQYPTFHISFASTSTESAYQQAEIINGFFLKSSRNRVVRLDDIGSLDYIPTERRKFTLLIIDSIQSLQAIDPLLKSRQYHTDGKHLVLISKSLPEEETMNLIQNVFEKFFVWQIANVELMVKNTSTGFMDFYTFFPVTPSFCFKVIPVLHNTFDGNQLMHKLTLFPRKFDNFFGCPLVLTAFHFPPHVFLSYENGELKIRGLDILVLKGVAEKLNFSISTIDAGTRGILLPNGTLTGALALLKNAEANITLGGFGSSSKAMLQFSPSNVYLYTSMVFALPSLREYSPLEKLLLPFDYDVWVAIGVTFGFTFLASILLEMWSKRFRDLVFGDTVKDPVFEMMAVYLGLAVVRFPKGELARNVILQWLIASLILSSCYKAILFGMLKDGFLKKFPSTIEGMLDLGYTVDVPLPLMQNLKDGPLGGRNSFFLLEHDLHTHYAMLQQGDPKRMVIDTRIQLEYYNTLNYRKTGVLAFLPQRLFLFPMYIYYRKDSYLVDPFNKALTRFVETGIMDYWRYLLLNVSHIRVKQIASSETKPLYLKDLTSCIAICDILLSCSIVVFVLEVLSTKFKSIKKLLFLRSEMSSTKKKLKKSKTMIK